MFKVKLSKETKKELHWIRQGVLFALLVEAINLLFISWTHYIKNEFYIDDYIVDTCCLLFLSLLAYANKDLLNKFKTCFKKAWEETFHS